jgi:MFS family permease
LNPRVATALTGARGRRSHPLPTNLSDEPLGTRTIHAIDPRARGLPSPLYGVLYLPAGLISGFSTVTLGYVLGHHGVSVAAVSGLVGLYLLPTTWGFLAGPIVDVSLTPRLWYVLTAVVLAGCFAAFALTPITAAAVPALGVLCLAASTASVCGASATTAAMALTTTPEERGPIAGWQQAANLGGAGLGGGLALWIVGHAGGPAAAGLTMAAISLACAAPLLLMRVPARAGGVRLGRRVGGMAREVWALARTRKGVLAVMIMTLPSALGACSGLLPAAAGAWHASSDLVALVRGALGGLTTIPGCILGGYLCRRFPQRTVYIWGALAYAGGLAAMALAPHTPAAFAGFVILNGMILGVAFGALTAVIFDCLGPTSAATIFAALASLSNVPLLLVTLLVGQAEARSGPNGMLMTEAVLGAVSVAAYAALAWFWREASRAPPLYGEEQVA